MKYKIFVLQFIMMCILLFFLNNCNNSNNNSNDSNDTTKQVSKDSSNQVAKEKNNTVTDIDGNIYHTVAIGSKVWLLENLRVTHFRNGDPIPEVSDNKKWTELSTSAYCNLNDSAKTPEIYGRIYNWYAVSDKRGLCPVGWHVPTKSDYEALSVKSILDTNITEQKLAYKSLIPGGITGFCGLVSPSLSNNPIGWTHASFFWTSTHYLTNTGNVAWSLMLYADVKAANLTILDYQSGSYVRCIKD